ncbi:MAG: hypothetical protein Q8940_02695, partial [Bacteroidota bacterium]|nr:hypothetical protein [Bacteroidota bacterium]
MKIKYFLALLPFFIVNEVNAQLIPSSINLEGNSLRKVSSETPISNSITDILAVGDTVWLGTSRGL